jgi:hypothetical protein
MKRTLPAPTCRLLVRKARVFEPPPIHELRSAVGKAARCQRGDRVDFRAKQDYFHRTFDDSDLSDPVALVEGNGSLLGDP